MNLKVYIRAQLAENGPPLGTILGNIGVNTSKFCKEFNDYTKDLPDYFKLGVDIDINESRNFTFNVKSPTTGYIISMLKLEENVVKSDGKIYIENYIFLDDLLKLSKFKFPDLSLKKSFPIILGSINATNIKIKIDNI